MHIEWGVRCIGVWLEFFRVQVQGNIKELTTFLFASMVIFRSHFPNIYGTFPSLPSPLPLGSVGPLTRHLCKGRFQLQEFCSTGIASKNRPIRGSPRHNSFPW